MPTPAEHRQRAEELLDSAKAHSPLAPARAALLAEAQVHATLALGPTEATTHNVYVAATEPQRPKAPRPRKPAASKTEEAAK